MSLRKFWVVIVLLFCVIGSSYSQKAIDCNNYAKIDQSNNGFLAGQLNVIGNQLTIEAVINPQGAYPNSNTMDEQDIVSKHHTPADANYLLRMNHAEITTSSGWYKTDDVCRLPTNQTFHIAMVYDGTSLKFYRNGSLIANKVCSGNLVQNGYPTTIGAFAAQDFDPYTTTPEKETFNGYINEVRIWNIARTAGELNEYKDKQLQNPSAQNGLLAYYQFNDLKNKQGNTVYDLTLLGRPFINQTPPSCILGQDPCPKCNLTASFTSTADICNPSKFNFENTTVGANTFQWSFGTSDNANSQQENPTYTYLTAGDYNVNLQVSDNNGCTASTSGTVKAVAQEEAILTPSTSICKGSSVILHSGVLDVGTIYTWSPTAYLSDAKASNPTATPDKSTNFQLLVQKANGCEQTGSVLVNVLSVADFKMEPSNTNVCPGSTVTLQASGGDVYAWYNAENELLGNLSSLTIAPEKSTKYHVNITSNTCQEKTSLFSDIAVFPHTEMIAKQSNPITCMATSTQLTVSNASSVQWQPTPGLEVEGNNANVKPSQTTTYYYRAEDVNGCYNDSSIVVLVDFITDGTSINIPNAFTPNGDGRNDIFRMKTNIALSRFEMKIFNRLGELVFRTNDGQKGWNGEWNGHRQPTGTYIFEVSAESVGCGTFHKKGTVVLIN